MPSRKAEPSCRQEAGFDDEDSCSVASSFEQLYLTRRASRGTKLLRALRLVPKSYGHRSRAEVGVQVGAPSLSDEGEATSAPLSGLPKRLSIQVQDYVIRLEGELDTLQRELESIKTEKVGLLNSNEKSRTEMSVMQKEITKMRAQLEIMEDSVETTRMENDFLVDDKEHVQAEQALMNERLARMAAELKEVQEQRDEFAKLFLNTRIKSSEVLGRYLDELNEALEEKREMIVHAKQGAKSKLAKILNSTEKYLKLKEEKNRLVEQVEYLSTKSVAQELHVESMQERLSELAKVLYAYEQSTGLSPDQVADGYLSQSGIIRVKSNIYKDTEKPEGVFESPTCKYRICLPVKTSTPIKGEEGKTRCHVPDTRPCHVSHKGDDEVASRKSDVIAHRCAARRELDLSRIASDPPRGAPSVEELQKSISAQTHRQHEKKSAKYQDTCEPEMIPLKTITSSG